MLEDLVAQNTILPIPPEFNRAVSNIHKSFINFKCGEYSTCVQTTKEIWLRSNNFSFFNDILKVKQIPSESGWRWNQAKGRISFINDDKIIKIDLAKLVPRKIPKRSESLVPSMKIWHAIVTNNNSKFTVLWCERGYDIKLTSKTKLKSTITPKPIQIMEEDNLNIDDYKFLAPYMDLESAVDLWPNLPDEI